MEIYVIGHAAEALHGILPNSFAKIGMTFRWSSRRVYTNLH